MNTILVIDDDDQLRISFCKLLREEKYSVLGAASGEAGVDKDSKLPLIIVTAFRTTETAIEAGYFMRSTVTVDAIPEKQSGDAIFGQSRAMQTVYKAIGRVS